MEHSDKHTYKDIAPEYISGNSSGISDNTRQGKKVNDTLFFVLGMNFLTSNIKDTHYDYEHVGHFCKQLLELFNGEGIPHLNEKWSEDSDFLNFEYESPIDDESKVHISRLVGESIMKHPSFAHKRDYYVLGNGLQNIDKAHNIKNQFNKQDALQYEQHDYAISLINIEDKKSGKKIVAGDVIIDDLNKFAEIARIKAEESSLRESFGSETLDEYIARLAFYQHDLRAHYDMEIKNANTRPWRLAVLASIIAYETNNKKEFYRMMMRKIGHINQIAESIREGYPSQTQKDLYLSFEHIRDVTWFTFNYRLIENLQKTYYRQNKLPHPTIIKNRGIKKYKTRFLEALQASSNFSLDHKNIDILVDIEEDNKDWINMYSKEKIDTLVDFEEWVIIEASKHNPDYLYIKEPLKLIEQDVFSYSSDELLDTIQTLPDGLLKCCAIWRYIFTSHTLLDFSQRFEKFSELLEEDYYFGGEIEAKLGVVYEGLPFTDLYAIAIAKAMIETAKTSIESIHELVVNTEEMHTHLKDSYAAEYDFILKLLLIVENPSSQEKEIGLLSDLYEGLVLGYSKNESDEGDDDEDDMSF